MKQGRSITWPLQGTVPSRISYNAEMKAYLKLKITILWDLMSCSLVDGYQGFRGMYCLHLQGRTFICPYVGGSMFFQNVSMIIQIITLHILEDRSSYRREMLSSLINKIVFTNLRLISHTLKVTTANKIILKFLFSSRKLHVRKLCITMYLFPCYT
jgi:hypothetical protein